MVHPSPLGTPAKVLTDILNMKLPVVQRIEIRLVGFQQYSGADPTMTVPRLTEVLNEMHTSMQSDPFKVHSIKPRVTTSSSPQTPTTHQMDVQQTVLFQVSHVKDAVLLDPIEAQLRIQVYEQEHTAVPVSSINQLVQDHFVSNPAYGAYVMYFLNPKIAKARVLDNNGIPEGWRQPVYRYVDDNHHNCGFQSYVDTHRRLVWIDISAGPSDIGPRTFGDGDVSEHTLLGGSNRWRGNNNGGGDLAGQLANQVWVARQHLFLPALTYSKEKHTRRGGKRDDGTNIDRPELSHDSINRDIVHIAVHDLQHQPLNQRPHDWAPMTTALKSMAPQHQSITFSYQQYNVLDYPLCLSALMQMANNKDLARKDRDRLNPCLQSLTPSTSALGSDDAKGASSRTVYPVYVVDGSYFLKALSSGSGTGWVALGLEQMALLVRTSNTPSSASPSSLSQFMCNGLPIATVPSHSSTVQTTFRTILSGLWGVVPTQHRWQEESSSLIEDWRWSASNTPFGPFAGGAGKAGEKNNAAVSYSFAQTDAVRRNEVYSIAQDILSELKAVVSNLTLGGGGIVGAEGNRRVSHVQLTVDEMKDVKHWWEAVNMECKRAGSYASILDFHHSFEHLEKMKTHAEVLMEELVLLKAKFRRVRSCAVVDVY